MIAANRYHDISVGHRVHGHESKCAHLHGHNYRIHFEVVAPQLDKVGRVLDFSVIKSQLCEWLERNWDHKFLMWVDDPVMTRLAAWVERTARQKIDYNPFLKQNVENSDWAAAWKSFVHVPFNPTAENMAQYLVEVVGPAQLAGFDCTLQRVVIEETRKCSCSYTRKDK